MPTPPAGEANSGSKKKRGGISDDDYFEPDEEELEEERKKNVGVRKVQGKIVFIVLPVYVLWSTALA